MKPTVFDPGPCFEEIDLTCPQCSAEVPDENRFCEECGTALGAPEPGCAKCGAPFDQVDAEGFCSACGFRRENRGRDHLERIISAQFAGITDRGLRHPCNEDAMELQWIEECDTAILVICDGVSSTTDADRASSVAAEAALRSLLGAVLKGHDTLEVAIEYALAAAQKVVAALGSGRSSPATTIVCALVQGNNVVTGWAGDSRAYWIGSNEVRQLTTDHSWMADVVAAGEDEEQAARSPNAHAITRWLGADSPQDTALPIIRYEMAGPGHLVLCTDGLWNYAPHPSDIAALVSTSDAIATVRCMIDFANARGGHDNITAVMLTRNETNVPIQS